MDCGMGEDVGPAFIYGHTSFCPTKALRSGSHCPRGAALPSASPTLVAEKNPHSAAGCRFRALMFLKHHLYSSF